MLQQGLIENNQNQLLKLLRISFGMTIYIKNQNFVNNQIEQLQKQNDKILDYIIEQKDENQKKKQKFFQVMCHNFYTHQQQIQQQENNIQNNKQQKFKQLEENKFYRFPTNKQTNFEKSDNIKIDYPWTQKLEKNKQYQNLNVSQKDFVYYTILQCLKPNFNNKKYKTLEQYIEDTKSERYEQFNLQNVKIQIQQHANMQIYLNSKYCKQYKKLFMIDDFDDCDLIIDDMIQNYNSEIKKKICYEEDEGCDFTQTMSIGYHQDLQEYIDDLEFNKIKDKYCDYMEDAELIMKQEIKNKINNNNQQNLITNLN